ncbi:MAG: hypothetical protein HUJ99_05470, partial [Bacteroidaceae bacterium]|nr:hypothetical protein [Bacteroidaceae bacterium]
ALYVLIGLKWARWASTKRLTGLKSAFSQDSDTQLVEPLVYSFKSKTLKYNSSKMGVMDDIAMEVSSARGELMTHYWGWIIFFLLFIVVFVLYHPALMDRWLPNTDNWIDQMHYWMEQIKDVR